MKQAIKSWWYSMGYWRWLNALILLTAIYLSIIFEAVPNDWVEYGFRSLGDIEVQFSTRGEIRPGIKFNGKIEATGSGSITIGFRQNLGEAISLDFAGPGSQEISLIAPESTEHQIFLMASNESDGLVRWNIGRLYD